MNFVPFSERALDMVVELYREACSHPTVIKAHVLQNILKVSPAPPLSLSVCLSVCVCQIMSVCLCLSVCDSVCLPVYVYLCWCLSVCDCVFV